MTLLLRNAARVSVLTAGSPTLTNVPAVIGVPTAKDQDTYGGSVRHVVLIDPLKDVHDCMPGYTLSILSWGQNAVDPARVYRVIESEPSGGLGLEVQRILIGEWIGR